MPYTSYTFLSQTNNTWLFSLTQVVDLMHRTNDFMPIGLKQSIEANVAAASSTWPFLHHLGNPTWQGGHLVPATTPQSTSYKLKSPSAFSHETNTRKRKLEKDNYSSNQLKKRIKTLNSPNKPSSSDGSTSIIEEGTSSLSQSKPLLDPLPVLNGQVII